MNKKAIPLILLCLALSGGCTSNASEKDSLGDSTSIQPVDEFDKSGLTVAELEALGCVFFENFAFAKSERSHVFVIENNEITRHTTFALTQFDKSNYERVKGMDLIEAMGLIGCPSYIGLGGSLSLDYSDADGYLRRVFLEKNTNSYKISGVTEQYKYANPSIWVDKNKEAHPSLEMFKKLRTGMNIDEVVRTVGKFTSYSNPNETAPFSPKIVLNDGREARLNLVPAQTNDCEYMRHDEAVRSTYEYLYLLSASLEGEEFNLPEKEGTTPFTCNDDSFMDDSVITVDYLRSKNCYFYGNMAFASDSKNHVFFLDGERITEHRTYEKINYGKNSADLFNSVAGNNLLDSFDVIGIPTYDGFGPGTLGYSLPYGKVYCLGVTKSNGAYLISNSLTILDKTNPAIWRNLSSSSGEAAQSSTIRNGMCIDEVVRALGRPKTHEFIGDTAYTSAQFGFITVTFKLQPIMTNCEYAMVSREFNLINGHYYTPNLYYFYVDSVRDGNVG